MKEKKTMDGLLITHGGKRYFVRPELLELCQVSEAELREAEKHKALPTDPVVALPTHGKEVSLQELSGVVGGVKTTEPTRSTIMCPSLF
jgi:hypothetical protein